MCEMSFSQLKEEKLRELLYEEYPHISSFGYSKQWMIDQIESLLEEFPFLRTMNYQEIGVNGLLALIKSKIDDVEVFSVRGNRVLVIEAKPSKPFLTMKEFMLFFVLSVFTKFSLFHFIFGKKKMETINCKYKEAFFYIYENSVVLMNQEKQQYHFIMSIESLINYIYTSPDQLVKKLSGSSSLPNKYGDHSISDFIISDRNNKKEITDIELDIYLKEESQYIDPKRNNIKKRKI
ncbi:MAG: hypothetical protein OQK03_11935 [Colwellia sp.]|nr:hypothetical protein [Colwellia sp.]